MKTTIEMAREVGLGDAEGWINEEYDYKNEILAFAALVRAEAQAEEREAFANDWETLHGYDKHGVAAAIRARGNT